MMRFARRWAVSLILLLITACTTTQPASPTPLPDAQTLMNKAAQEVKNAKSLKFKLQLSGAPSFVDPPTEPGGPGNNISFVSADGAYVSPDRVQAKVVAKLFGLAGEVEVIAIGDCQWMRNKILTADKWVAQIFSPGFNAAKLVSSDEGIQAALKALKDVKLVGQETVDGVPMYHITGKADGKDIAALTVGLIRGSDVQGDIYIVIETGRVDRVQLVQPDTITEKEPKPTTWLIEIFDYDKADAKITAPDGSTTCTQQPSSATQPAATSPFQLSPGTTQP
ncbi:MAG: LppX_LprAFG lipoprotein [Anaerolineae bacterium]|nr:LppX_LprAFG lipoprotein [Anaerolineae bacterium]